MKSKRCYHRKIELIGYKATPHIDTSVLNRCLECGALQNSIALGSKWVKGEEANKLYREMQTSFGSLRLLTPPRV